MILHAELSAVVSFASSEGSNEYFIYRPSVIAKAERSEMLCFGHESGVKLKEDQFDSIG